MGRRNSATSTMSTVQLSDLAVHSPSGVGRNGSRRNSDQFSILDHDPDKAGFQHSSREVYDRPQSPVLRYWRTSLMIVGPFFAAFVFALLHYVFFKTLDGDEASDTSVLRQQHITTISFLLVTAFRAALITVLGTCFTQYLWYLLRAKPLRVGLIEDLFHIRSNPLGLANPNVVRHAPIIFLVASFSWIVPLATVYPPGALTIRSEPRSFLSNVNASIMNPSPAQVHDEAYGDRALAVILRGEQHRLLGSLQGEVGSDSMMYRGPTPSLKSMTKHIMFTGKLVNLTPLTSENSSYTMIFEGPRVRCNDLKGINTTIHHNDTVDLMAFNATWISDDYSDNGPILDVSYTRGIGYYPAPRRVDEKCTDGGCSYYIDPPYNATVTSIVQRQTLRCDPYTAMYAVNISYVRGVQHITYSTSAEKRLQFLSDNSFRWNATESYELPNTTQEYKDWAAHKSEWAHKANSRAIFDSVGFNLHYQWGGGLERDDENAIVGTYRLPNGTEVKLGGLSFETSDTLAMSSGIVNNYTMLEDSILNVNRFGQNDTYRFDPKESLNITEASINDLLANATISALSLNTWYGNITVRDTEFRNIYRFSHPINLFIPYGICLALTLLFIGIGLRALILNGVPATDGGFLQIMMTTAGETAMSRAAADAYLEDRKNELLDMKVRFGELAGDDRKRVGFGTIEETLPLSKDVLVNRKKTES